MREPLGIEEVRHIARLARLDLDAAHLEAYRTQLTTILDHIERLAELDVDGVEPMAYPVPVTNRLDDDVPVTPDPIEHLHRNAPCTEGDYLAVPKVLDDGGASA